MSTARDRDNQDHAAEAARRLATTRPDDVCQFVAWLDLQTGKVGHQEKIPADWGERDAVTGEVAALMELGVHFLREAIERAGDYEDDLAEYYRGRIQDAADMLSDEARSGIKHRRLFNAKRQVRQKGTRFPRLSRVKHFPGRRGRQ